MLRNSLRTSRFFIAAMALAAATPVLHTQESFVPVNAEPKHHLKLDSAKYRIYDVLVEPGEATLFHQHKADIFAVLLTRTELTNQLQGGPKAVFHIEPGLVNFAPASEGKPYVHQVAVTGSTPFRNITLELLQAPAPARAAGASEPVDPALVMLRESPRGKAFRLTLEPSQSARLPSGASDLLLVCLAEGRVAQQRAGQAPANWDCKTGDFRLLEQAREDVLKNESAARLDLIVIAIE